MLTHARLSKIANELPYEYELQKRVVDVVIEHNLVADRAMEFAKLVAMAHKEGDQEKLK